MRRLRQFKFFYHTGPVGSILSVNALQQKFRANTDKADWFADFSCYCCNGLFFIHCVYADA